MLCPLMNSQQYRMQLRFHCSSLGLLCEILLVYSIYIFSICRYQDVCGVLYRPTTCQGWSLQYQSGESHTTWRDIIYLIILCMYIIFYIHGVSLQEPSSQVQLFIVTFKLMSWLKLFVLPFLIDFPMLPRATRCQWLWLKCTMNLSSRDGFNVKLAHLSLGIVRMYL